MTQAIGYALLALWAVVMVRLWAIMLRHNKQTFQRNLSAIKREFER